MPAAVAKIRCQARWLRERGYSRAYLLKRSFSSGLLAWLAGIPWRVGHVGESRGWLLSRGVSMRPGRHQAESYLDLLRDDGIDVDDGHNENWTDADAVAAADALLAGVPADRRRVFLAVRSTNADKHWPTERWVEVVDRLVRHHGCEVFFCGGPADVKAHERIVAQRRDRRPLRADPERERRADTVHRRDHLGREPLRGGAQECERGERATAHREHV